MDNVYQSIFSNYTTDIMLMPYTKQFGQLLSAVRNETGIELSFRDLWLRIISLRERCEIYDDNSL